MPTLGDRLRYRFDTSMARGPSALIGYLGIAVVVLALVFGLLLLLLSLGPTENPIHAVYNALLHVIDPGTVVGDDTASPGFVALMLALTLGGVVIFSAFIGVLASAVDQRLQQLRKGRSAVLEAEHTLVLGWSDTIFTVLAELALANESRRDPVVVVLADRDKVEMEDAIRDKAGDLRGTRVVCRTGSAIDLRDLSIVAPQHARAIIVLSPDEPEPDASVIKTILALTRGPARGEGRSHIVAEIAEAANLEVARLVGGDEAVLVDKSETVARIIVQTARQSGAAVVYTELLDFEGEEIYFRADEQLIGRTYAEALLAYEACAVIGVHVDGTSQLNPPPGYVLPPGAQVIAIAEDDETLANAVRYGQPLVDDAAVLDGSSPSEGPQRSLILGYNARTATVLRELDQYVAPGSSVLLVADAIIERPPDGLRNLTVDVRRSSTTDREALETLGLAGFHHAIVMAPEGYDPQRADARTLITLLHLRDIEERERLRVPIVSEMLDDRNRQLAQVTKVDDVIVSDQLISLLLTQIAENPHLADVFGELFSSEGAEVYLRDATSYVVSERPVAFATLVAAASRRGETAIGYRRAAEPDNVLVNPAKTAPFTPVVGDRLIVLAES
jgi:voltage-gated potassium channel Kch